MSRLAPTICHAPPRNLTPADFSEGLFWDVAPDTLDIERHLKHVVARVLEAGTLED